MQFRNFPLARKLAIGFGVVLAIVAVSSAFIFVQTQKVAEIERLNSTSDDAVDLIDQVSAEFSAANASLNRFVVSSKEADKEKISKNIENIYKNIDSIKTMLVKDNPENVSLLTTFHGNVERYVSTEINVTLDLASDPAKRQQAITMLGSETFASATETLEQSLAALRERVNAWSDGWTEAGNRGMDQIEVIVAIGGLLSLALGCVMAWVIVRAVAKPLQAMTAAMRLLASGDTRVDIPAIGQSDEIGQMAGAVQVFKQAGLEKMRLEVQAQDGRRQSEEERARNESDRAKIAQQQAQVVDAIAQGLDRLSNGALTYRIGQTFSAEYDKLRLDFNDAMSKLQDTMVVVAGNTSAIRSGTGEISSAAEDLSRRTEQQAASLEETAAALDEITATVRRTAQGSRHARDVVGETKNDAELSGRIVRQAIEAMSGIERSSNQIGQIIGVIDEIAFQTNLLALNAGVEAARAGDAGRGFAVVASEVRALAQRSAEAAKEIKTLISASSAQVEQGVSLVDQTSQALDRIMKKVTEINAIVTDIAASAQEQATGLEQINTAVNQMDQVTQQNAAMVEESTAASQALAKETDGLSRLIAGFEVGRTESSSEPRAATKAFRPQKPAPAKTAPALKTTGRGGAAAKSEAAEEKNWEEF